MGTKVSSVSSSQIGQYGRLDAGFNILINDIQSELADVRANFDEIAAVNRCTNIATPFAAADLEFLKPLSRRNPKSNTWTKTDIETIIAAYPFETLALFKRHAKTLMAKAEADKQAALDVSAEKEAAVSALDR